MDEIIFDGRWMGMHGIGRFATEVAKNLGLSTAELRGNPSSPFDWLYLSIRLASRKEGIFFTPGYSYPLFYGGKGVLVVHDLNHLDIPGSGSILKKIYYKVILKAACRHASSVLTVSEFSRKRVSEFTGVDPKKIIIVGNGVSEAFSDTGSRFELDGGAVYFLGISNGKSHKNNLNVVDGFVRANLGSRVNLLFAGSPSKEVSAFIKRLGVGDRIKFMGRLSEGELASLYRGALALIFPSLYEGFGLPIIESMACGTPVITSNCTAMPEIAGSAALLVNPRSADEIAEAVVHIFRHPELRRAMAAKGIDRARAFKWGDVARKVGAALAEARVRIWTKES